MRAFLGTALMTIAILGGCAESKAAQCEQSVKSQLKNNVGSTSLVYTQISKKEYAQGMAKSFQAIVGNKPGVNFQSSSEEVLEILTKGRQLSGWSTIAVNGDSRNDDGVVIFYCAEGEDGCGCVNFDGKLG